MWHAARMDLRNAHRPQWYVVSLRPRGEHASMQHAADAYGAALIELSPWALHARDDDATRRALDAALDADAVIATSISAVRAAVALRPLHKVRARWIAIGAGTAQALHDAGAGRVETPATRMDSDGVLALPILHAGHVHRIGLVTAPGGRDALQPALHARGLQVARADVYERVVIDLDPGTLDRIRTLDAPAALAVSSSGALLSVLERVDGATREHLTRMQMLAASERIAALARARGCIDVAVAASARPHDLLAVARPSP